MPRNPGLKASIPLGLPDPEIRHSKSFGIPLIMSGQPIYRRNAGQNASFFVKKDGDPEDIQSNFVIVRVRAGVAGHAVAGIRALGAV